MVNQIETIEYNIIYILLGPMGQEFSMGIADFNKSHFQEQF